MNLKRFDLYCSGHLAEDRDECEYGEYVDAVEAFKEIERLRAETNGLKENEEGWRKQAEQYMQYALNYQKELDTIREQNDELLQALRMLTDRCSGWRCGSAYMTAMDIISKARGEGE